MIRVICPIPRVKKSPPRMRTKGEGLHVRDARKGLLMDNQQKGSYGVPRALHDFASANFDYFRRFFLGFFFFENVKAENAVFVFRLYCFFFRDFRKLQ